MDWPKLVMKQILNVWELISSTAWRQHHGSPEREVSVESSLIFVNQILR